MALLPDGDYAASDVIDGDGGSDEAIAVAVVVRIRGDADGGGFHRLGAARAAPINCSRGRSPWR